MTVRVWFTADLHLGHEMVARVRGFDCSHDHDRAVLDSIRDTVGKDTLYILGDVMWGAPQFCNHTLFSTTPNGFSYFPKQTHLIYGNHDDALRKDITLPFATKQDMKYIKVGPHKIHLCHYPLQSWRSSIYRSWHLHGHCHGNMPESPSRFILDVGWDCFKRPINQFEIEDIFTKRLEAAMG